MKLFIALALIGTPAAAQDMVEATVLAATIDRGAIVGAADLETQTLAATSARGALGIAQIVGKEATRRLEAGRIVRAYDVAAPQLVKRGQTVTVMVQKGGLAIAASGRALTGGDRGATVRVQNNLTRAVVEGEVVAEGTVRITQFGAPAIPAVALR